MGLNENIINELKADLGEIKSKKAEAAVKENRVRIESVDLKYTYDVIIIRGSVFDNISEIHYVDIRLGLNNNTFLYGHNCTCHPYSYKECEHILAVLLEFYNNTKYMDKIEEIIKKEQEEEEKIMFNNIIEKFKNDEESDSFFKDNEITTSLNNNIDIIPVLKLNRYGEYEVSFKIGENKMYKIKNIEEFYKNFTNSSIFKYGEHLAFEHKEQVFTSTAKDFLKFILKYGQAIYFGNVALENRATYNNTKIPTSSLILKEAVLEDFFEILKKNKSMIELDSQKINLNFINSEDNIKFYLEELEEEKYRLYLNHEDLKILNGLNKIYVINENNVYEYDKKKYNDVFRLISMFNSRNRTEFIFKKEELVNFVNNVLPKVRDCVSFEKLSKEVIDNYIPKKLGVKVYLDLTEKGDILATVKFCYDNIEFEPFSTKIPSIPRDMATEKRVLQRFIMDGFSYSKNYESFLMEQEEQIYNFIINSINYYMENYEVLISEDFKKREIRRPKITTLGVKIQNNLLNIDLTGLDFDSKELKSILEKYKLKKKYHRLKNGEFLSLEENEDLDFIGNLTEGMEVDYSSLSKGKIRIPVNRTLYLNKLLDNIKNVEINEDKNFREIIINTENAKNDEDILIPKELDTTLRTYQKTGYKWLKVLDKYKFGGILADDMGLRKNFTSNCCYFRR